MKRVLRYELGLNWAGRKDNIFTQEIARMARRYRIRWVCVPKLNSDKFRRGVEKGSIKIGVFLNTQADGVNLESPIMLLCRSLKAHNTLVVEDPDDVKNYADKGFQLSCLQRAGLPVPKHYVIDDWKGNKPPTGISKNITLDSKWVARSAVGMNRQLFVISEARSMTKALVKAGFKPGTRILIHRNYAPLVEGNRELRFKVWYLFGHIVPCWYQRGVATPEILRTGDISFPFLGQLINIMPRIAEITLLDWFVTELVVVSKGNKKKELIIREPANALAGIGPGNKPLSNVPTELLRIAAHRIVKIAWRYANNLPLFEGISIHLA